MERTNITYKTEPTEKQLECEHQWDRYAVIFDFNPEIHSEECRKCGLERSLSFLKGEQCA